MAGKIQPSSIAYWPEGKLRTKIRKYAQSGEVLKDVSVSGSLAAEGCISANGFGNSQVILTPTVVPPEYNCLLYGPVTIRDEGTLQIGADSVVIVRTFLDFTGSLDTGIN